MIITLSPACFLAIAFHKCKKNFLDYDWLNVFHSNLQRMKMTNNKHIVVNWDHDSVNYTMGYFAPIFQANETGINCNLEILEVYYNYIVQEISEDSLNTIENCVDALT